MAKRKTKAQRETEQKAALRQRVADIATGAAGYEFDCQGEFSTAEMLSRFIPALKVQFDEEGRSHLWNAGNLNNYENIDSTADFLWEYGVRA